MATPKSIRRDQLARFIPDQETIIRFQQLFEAVNTTLPGSITESTITTQSMATVALGEAYDLATELEFMAHAI